MADALADRLKQMAKDDALGQNAKQDVASFQKRVDEYISQNAQSEFERLRVQIRKRLNELNAEIEGLPKFELFGDAVQQGNCVAGILFDKPITNMPNNHLFLSIGPHPHAMYFSTRPPAPKRFRFMAAATDSLDGIIWIGDLGEITSSQLTDVVFESLTAYYLQHKPKPLA